MRDFLRETVYRLYLLYFRPSELERQLRHSLENQREGNSPLRLLGIADKLDQSAARRYLLQMALWCLAAAAPFVVLAPLATTPPTTFVLLLALVTLWVIGFGVAFWDASLAPATALLFALLLAGLSEPGGWWGVLTGQEVLAEIQQLLWPDFLVGLIIGLAVGLVVGGVVRRFLTGSRAGGVAVGVAVVVAVGVAGGVAVGVAVVVAVGVGEEDLATTVVATVAASVVTSVVTFCVAAMVAVIAAGVVVNIYLLSVSILIVIAFMSGWVAGSRRLSRSNFYPFVFLIVLPTIFMSKEPLTAGTWLLAGFAGLIRLPLPLIYIGYTLFHYRRSIRRPSEVWNYLRIPPWQVDELILDPLPRLTQLLVVAGQQDRERGLAAIASAANTWRQGAAAQGALLQLVALELDNRESERKIAATAGELNWLPEILPQTVKDTVGRFRAVSRMVGDKLTLTDPDAQMAQLNRATAELDNLIQGLTFVPQAERERFIPIAQSWRETLKAATVRLPNPYVAGDPLRGGQAGLFVGRDDILRQLQAHLQDRSQRPTLLLFGQRRMGKSSLLYQLPDQFDDNTIPVRVDCQAGEMQESNAAFLYNLARAIQRQAQEHRLLDFPPPPPQTAMTFTAFNEWLDEVERTLDKKVLLLSLDEFESVGNAVAKGWLDERILDFLRNLIQHHPKVNLLLAGSHRPAEIGRPWSNYLISAVVLPISYLNPTDVTRLITKPIPGFQLKYTDVAVQHIIDLTRCQPLLVQLLCQQIVLLLNERGERFAGVAEVEAAVPGALSQGGSLYFTYLREYDAGSEGQTMLQQLAQAGEAAVLPESDLTHNDPTRQQALQRLLARDIVEQVDGRIRFQVELTRRWWAEYGRTPP